MYHEHNPSTSLTTTESFKKSINYHSEISREKRQEIIKKYRKEYHQQKQHNEEHNHFLRCEIFEKYHEIPLYKLNTEELYEHLSTINGEELSEETTYELCQDLIELFLLLKEEFELPFCFKFLKDKSSYTASIVAYASEWIEVDELKYWLEFMDEDSRVLVYSSVIPEEDRSQIWVQDGVLLEYVMLDLPLMIEAQEMVIGLLRYCEFVDEGFCLKVYEKVINVILQAKKKKAEYLSAGMFCLIIRLMLEMLELKQEALFNILKLHLNEALFRFGLDHNTLQLFDSHLANDLQHLIFECQKTGFLVLEDECFSKLIGYVCENFIESISSNNNINNNTFNNNINNNNKIYTNSNQQQQQQHQLYLNRFHKTIIECLMNYLRLYSMFKNFPNIKNEIFQSIQVDEYHENYKVYLKLIEFVENERTKNIKRHEQELELE